MGSKAIILDTVWQALWCDANVTTGLIFSSFLLSLPSKPFVSALFQVDASHQTKNLEKCLSSPIELGMKEGWDKRVIKV